MRRVLIWLIVFAARAPRPGGHKSDLKRRRVKVYFVGPTDGAHDGSCP